MWQASLRKTHKKYLETKYYTQNTFLKVLVYGNIFISIAGLAQVLFTQLVFKIPFNYYSISYLIFIFLSTYLQYNMQRGYNLLQQNPQTERELWLLHHRKPMLVSLGISLVALLFLCNWLSWTSIYIMVGAELVSTLYYMKPFNLRKYGFIKPLIVAAIWVISCVVVPLIENNLLSINAYYFVAAQFFFITTLCVLFDIKDAEHDFFTGIKTYANTWGIKGARLVAFIFLLAYFTCFYFFNPQFSITFFNSGFLILCSAFIFLTHETRHPYYYYLFVDGLMIAQLMLVLCYL